MNIDGFYERIIAGAAEPADVRHALYIDVHTDLLDRYLDVVNAITPEQAAQPVNRGDDQRTLAQLVGHIAEWDRFSILAASDMLAGLKEPRSVRTIEGYVDSDGTLLSFSSVDEFNQYQAEKQASWSWEQICTLACGSAQTLHALFADEWLLNAERLEQTVPWKKRLKNGVVLEALTMGWVLWLIELEHLGVEHAAELHLYDDFS